MTRRRIIIFVGVIVSASFFGQKTKDQLQKQNAEIKNQIAVINQNLAKTQSDARLSVAYLDNVNNKIALREKAYNNTQKEKKLIEDEIYLRQLEINRQNRELEILRKNYAQVLVKAYKNKGVQNKVTFILSSKNIGEALRRAQYLRLYSNYQDKKAEEINGKAEELKKAITQKQKSVNEKKQILSNQEKDLEVINGEKKQKEELLIEFKKNEAKLTADLKQKQAQSKALEGKIRNIIAEEIRIAKAKEAAEKKAEAERAKLAKIAADKEKERIEAENRAKIAAAEEAKRKADAEAKKLADIATKKAEEERKRTEEAAKSEATARDKARRDAAAKEAEEAVAKAKIAAEKAATTKATAVDLAKKNEDAKKEAEAKTMKAFDVGTDATESNFMASKGKIGMPVSGNITHYFGRHQHPVFKNIVEDNTGIKIAVSPGTKARCVFPGTVSSIQINGSTKTVIVKHGDYFTIFSNLNNTYVTKGQQIVTGAPIGEVGDDFDGSTTLDFQIWNGTTPVNPLDWVSN